MTKAVVFCCDLPLRVTVDQSAHVKSNNYTMVCHPVHGDNPGALASELSEVIQEQQPVDYLPIQVRQ